MFKNIDFFNIDHLEAFGDSYKLERFPKELEENLGCEVHKRGRFYSHRAIGSEIRFKCAAPFFDITIGSYKEETSLYIFFGDYFFKKIILEEGTMKTYHIEIPEKMKLKNLPRGDFSNDVIRILIGFSGYVLFKGVETFGFEIVKPSLDDYPKKKLLIYGSSISHGSEALEYVTTAPFLLSHMLHADVINKSIPGSCQAEEKMVKYLSTLDYDTAFVEYGVNVLSLYNTNEYKTHLDYILKYLINRPLYLTSIYDNGRLLDEASKEYQNLIEFRQIISAVKQLNVEVINPADILSKLNYLTCDLLHPSDMGQIEIAMNLSKIIKM